MEKNQSMQKVNRKMWIMLQTGLHKRESCKKLISYFWTKIFSRYSKEPSQYEMVLWAPRNTIGNTCKYGLNEVLLCKDSERINFLIFLHKSITIFIWYTCTLDEDIPVHKFHKIWKFKHKPHFFSVKFLSIYSYNFCFGCSKELSQWFFWVPTT